MHQSTLLLAATVLAGAFGTAHAAPVHTYEIDDPAGSATGGDIKSVRTTYDTDTSTFSWEYTIENKNNGARANDSFWLVVSDGENPKDNPREYAILFGDLEANTLWAYEYNGLNKSDSWSDPGNLLAVWSNDSPTTLPAPGGSAPQYTGVDPFTITRDGLEQTVSFSIDVAAINALPHGADWDGIAFGDRVGIWFHPGRNSTFTTSAETLGIESYGAKAGYFDGSNFATARVPEPTTLSMLGLGALGLARVRRRTARAVAG